MPFFPLCHKTIFYQDPEGQHNIPFPPSGPRKLSRRSKLLAFRRFLVLNKYLVSLFFNSNLIMKTDINSFYSNSSTRICRFVINEYFMSSFSTSTSFTLRCPTSYVLAVFPIIIATFLQ